MSHNIWTITRGDGPIVAVALHDGHEVRAEVAAQLALPAAERLREEDPFTGEWTWVGDTRVIGTHSRFEVELNRPREKAVYLTPADAWGLDVWTGGRLPDPVAATSYAAYDAFYDAMRDLLADIQDRHGRFVVLDLHSYNHRRDGATSAPAPELENPQVNLGTGSMDRSRWAALVDRFMFDLRRAPFPGGSLDVRENVRFRGGRLSQWVHETFPETGSALAIEVKKFFMDEWTGELDRPIFDAVGAALATTVPGLREEIGRSAPRLDAGMPITG